jgi:hypothetical protein
LPWRTGKSPNQAEPKSADLSGATKTDNSASAVTSAPTTQLDVASTPAGADIEIDGKFVGNTPSSISVAPGDHEISVKKTGFGVWTRKMAVSAGHININAELTAEAH